MDSRLIDEIAGELRRKESALLQAVAENQEEAKAAVDLRGSELEESAQNDRILRLASRLGERDRDMIRQIRSALERIIAGTYGKCESCANEIGENRLRVLPTATLCIDCASAREKKERSTGKESASERLPVRAEEYASGLDAEEAET